MAMLSPLTWWWLSPSPRAPRAAPSSPPPIPRAWCAMSLASTSITSKSLPLYSWQKGNNHNKRRKKKNKKKAPDSPLCQIPQPGKGSEAWESLAGFKALLHLPACSIAQPGDAAPGGRRAAGLSHGIPRPLGPHPAVGEDLCPSRHHADVLASPSWLLVSLPRCWPTLLPFPWHRSGLSVLTAHFFFLFFFSPPWEQDRKASRMCT